MYPYLHIHAHIVIEMNGTVTRSALFRLATRRGLLWLLFCWKAGRATNRVTRTSPRAHQCRDSASDRVVRCSTQEDRMMHARPYPDITTRQQTAPTPTRCCRGRADRQGVSPEGAGRSLLRLS